MCLVVVTGLLSACQADPPDRRAVIHALTHELGRMPGVDAARDEVADDVAQGRVYFVITVDVAESITGDQVAAVVSRYLQGLRGADLSRYRAELDAARGWNVFAVDSGRIDIANAAQVTAQASDWVALRETFPGATVRLRATVTDAFGRVPSQQWRESNAGSVHLPDATDYADVINAVTTLARQFPHLSGLDWTVASGRRHPASVESSRRFPTADELDVWRRLNADQRPPHADKLTINGPFVAPVWFGEQTRSHDLHAAFELAHSHLPMVATLPGPMLYTASDQLGGRINGYGRATAPIAVTVGGCTDRDYLVYQPPPAEQALIDEYERCPP